jgi:hypothetical protein
MLLLLLLPLLLLLMLVTTTACVTFPIITHHPWEILLGELGHRIRLTVRSVRLLLFFLPSVKVSSTAFPLWPAVAAACLATAVPLGCDVIVSLIVTI